MGRLRLLLRLAEPGAIKRQPAGRPQTLSAVQTAGRSGDGLLADFLTEGDEFLVQDHFHSLEGGIVNRVWILEVCFELQEPV